jgi:hypothetical protein
VNALPPALREQLVEALAHLLLQDFEAFPALHDRRVPEREGDEGDAFLRQVPGVTVSHALANVAARDGTEPAR